MQILYVFVHSKNKCKRSGFWVVALDDSPSWPSSFHCSCLGLVLDWFCFLVKNKTHDCISVPVFLGNPRKFSIWNFPTLGVPPNHHVNKIIHYKPSILGVLPLYEHPDFLAWSLAENFDYGWQTSLERTPSFAGFFLVKGFEGAIVVNDSQAWGPYESRCVELGRRTMPLGWSWVSPEYRGQRESFMYRLYRKGVASWAVSKNHVDIANDF